MRVVLVGAGSVGRSIARELLLNDHQVLLIDKYARESRVQSIPEATWLLADACEVTTLHEAQLEAADVVVCATGDDKVNLVVSLLAKTEFGVPRTVARVNNPKNEWMFDDGWGVDVAVSTPRLMTALVEEAVSVGDLVHLPADCVLVGIIRDQLPIAPSPHDTLHALDELLFLATPSAERELAATLTGRRPEEISTVHSDPQA